jgi:hypothetical protein
VVNGVAFDAVGRWLAAAVERQGLRMWDLTGPSDAEPIGLGRGAVNATIAAVCSIPLDAGWPPRTWSA